MNKLKYDITPEIKSDILYLIDKIVPVYKRMQMHTKMLECSQWYKMITRLDLKNEFKISELISLKKIMNDCVNYFISVENDFDIGNKAMKIMQDISKIFYKKGVE